MVRGIGASTSRGRTGPLGRALAAVSMVAGAGCGSFPRPPEAWTPVEKRCRHVLRIAVGCGCHGLNFAGWKEGGPDLLPRTLPYGERFVGQYGVIPASNITPDRETGIGRWSESAIARYLRTGSRPDGSLAQSLMAGLIFSSSSHLTSEEAHVIAADLKRIPPVRHRPEEQPSREAGAGSPSGNAHGLAVHLGGAPLLRGQA